MRKTKIVCTMGPSTDKPGILRQLMENGMNVARFNFSHGDYEEHKGRFDKVRALSKELNLPIACMLDTKGPRFAWVSSRTASRSSSPARNSP